MKQVYLVSFMVIYGCQLAGVPHVYVLPVLCGRVAGNSAKGPKVFA